MNGRRSSKALRALNWHSLSLPCGPLVVHSGLKLCLYWTLAKTTLLAISTKCKKAKWKRYKPSPAFVPSPLGSSRSRIGWVSTQLGRVAVRSAPSPTCPADRWWSTHHTYVMIGGEVHIIRAWWSAVIKVLEAKNLQLCVLDGAVDAERSEPVHLRRRLPLVTEVPRSLQLNVYPATRVWF